MPNNRKTVVSRALFMGVGVFVVVSLWGWIESGNIELLQLLLNAILGIVFAVLIILPMPNNVMSRALFMGVGVFVVVSLWGWIGSGNIELLRLLLNAIVGIVLAVAFVVVDKIFLKEAEKA